MDFLPSEKSSSPEISRKKFLLGTGAAAGAMTLLGPAFAAAVSGSSPAGANTADQVFSGKVFFKSGQPWIDVKAYGAMGNGTTPDDAAIHAALTAAVPTAQIATGNNNAVVYFPPGDYLITGTVLPPSGASYFCIMGAGSQSSRLIWGGAAGQPMLKLRNAGGVQVKDLGFIGSATAMPSFGLQADRSDDPCTVTPTAIVCERLFFGNPNGDAVNLDVAIGYTAGHNDSNNEAGTFRDIVIRRVNTGYKFGSYNGLIHNIISGSVQHCAKAAVDTTANPGSIGGGSFTMLGTRFSHNAITFQIGQSPGDSINIVGIQVDSDARLLHTPAPVIGQPVTFIGGTANLLDPEPGHDSICFDAPNGLLEFHGCDISSPHGVVWNFPNTVPVNFVGGCLRTAEWKYNGPLQFTSTHEIADAPVFTPKPGSVTARRLDFGTRFSVSSGTIPGSRIHMGSAAGTGASLTIEGNDIAGTITVTTGLGNLAAGSLGQIDFERKFAGIPRVILSPGNAHAAGIMNAIYTAPNSIVSMTLCTVVALPASTQYVLNYLVLG